MDISAFPEFMQVKMAILFPLVIVLNGLWYLSKFILKKNEFKISWLGNHWQDIPNMFKLAKNTEESPLKVVYFVLPIIIILGIPSMFITLFWGLGG